MSIVHWPVVAPECWIGGGGGGAANGDKKNYNLHFWVDMQKKNMGGGEG